MNRFQKWSIDVVLIGNSLHYETAVAIRRAASSFLLRTPLLILAFIGGRHSGEEAIQEMARLFPGVPVVGGSVAGVVTRQEATYSGFEVAMVAFVDASITPEILFAEPGLPSDFERAFELGRYAAQKGADGRCAILLYDSVCGSEARRLHYGSTVARAFDLGLATSSVSTVGAGLLTDFNLEDSWLYDGNSVRRHSVVALIFPRCVGLNTTILQGSRPTGMWAQITQIAGAEVIELDGRPAFTVLCEALGRDPRIAQNVLALNVSLGLYPPSIQCGLGSGDVVNRLILSEDRRTGTVTLFEPDFESGDNVQIMLQDADYMESEARRVAALQYSSRDRDPVIFNLYIDCAGRSRILSGTGEEEGKILLLGLPPAWPSVGIYSGVEIAPVRGQSRALDLTGVLAKFTMR